MMNEGARKNMRMEVNLRKRNNVRPLEYFINKYLWITTFRPLWFSTGQGQMHIDWVCNFKILNFLMGTTKLQGQLELFSLFVIFGYERRGMDNVYRAWSSTRHWIAVVHKWVVERLKTRLPFFPMGVWLFKYNQKSSKGTIVSKSAILNSRPSSPNNCN